MDSVSLARSLYSNGVPVTRILAATQLHRNQLYHAIGDLPRRQGSIDSCHVKAVLDRKSASTRALAKEIGICPESVRRILLPIRLYTRGVSIKKIIAITGIGVTKLYNRLPKESRRIKAKGDDLVAAIRNANLRETTRALAARLGVPKSTVHRIRTRDTWNETDPEEVPQIDFATKTHRCPKHGLVTTWPCVICSASVARPCRVDVLT